MIAEIIASTRKLLAERRDKAERAAIAKAFNDRYTYRRTYRTAPGCYGYAWMCPACNQAHAATECTVWTGVQYPACCGTLAGHRLSEGIRTS